MRLVKENVCRIVENQSEIRRLKEMGFCEVPEAEQSAPEAEQDESPVLSASNPKPKTKSKSKQKAGEA